MAKVGTKRTELLAEIQKLTQEDQYKLLEELVLLLKNKSKEKHDIEELKGLGKDVWKSVNYLYLKEEDSCLY
ncbi:MAG: hypothetical protein ACLFVB_10235 [Thermoplasmata archaeon]